MIPLNQTVTVGFHPRPWKLSIYVNIINKLVDACQAAQKEENENLSLFKREMIDTEKIPKFLRKQQMKHFRTVQRVRSDEARRTFRQMLSSMQVEIEQSLPEIKWLYNQAIEEGMMKYYSSESDLELKASNHGHRYNKVGWEEMTSVFIAAVETENISLLYYVDKYSPATELNEGFIDPWKLKTALKHNKELGKIKVLLTFMANIPQFLSEIVADPNKSRNYAIPEGTALGEGPEILLYTLLRSPTSFLKTL